MRWWLLLLLTAVAAALSGRVMKRLAAPDRVGEAVLLNRWKRPSPGPEYPLVSEVWWESGKQRRKLHEFWQTTQGRRQIVELEGWSGTTLLVSRCLLNDQRMTDDYASSMRSCLWHLSRQAGVAVRCWGRGELSGKIMDVQGQRVCLATGKADTGGGAGWPPWTSWSRLEVTDLEGRSLAVWDGVELSGEQFSCTMLSPRGQAVAFLDCASPGAEDCGLTLGRLEGGPRRHLKRAGLFRWRTDDLIEVGDPVRVYSLNSGRFQ